MSLCDDTQEAWTSSLCVDIDVNKRSPFWGAKIQGAEGYRKAQKGAELILKLSRIFAC